MPRVLKELANVTARPLSAHGGQWKFLRLGRKPASLLSFRRARVKIWEGDGANNPGKHFQTQ